MFKLSRVLALAVLNSSLVGNTVFAKDAGRFTFENFDNIKLKIEDVIQKHGAKNVLIALDIDNTTMVLERDLGSEHWFMWQSKLIADGNFSGEAIARTVPDLLNVQTVITNLSPMRPVEPEIPLALSQYVTQGATALALTSRSPTMADRTIAELERSGFPYSRSMPNGISGFVGKSKPYDLSNLAAQDLSQDDVERFSLKAPKDVLFERGVFLTQGQHKGIMLRTLLSRIEHKPTAVVFIDDRAHHLEGMQLAFESKPIEVTTVQYTHQKSAIETFNAGPKDEVKASWCVLSRALTEFHRSGEELNFIPCL